MTGSFYRSRFKYMIITLVIIILGLVSRSLGSLLPKFIILYLGDILWGLMVFLLTGLIFCSKSTFKVAAIAVSISMTIELSQLYHAAWIDDIRTAKLGGLLLGHGFLWSDIICYLLGITIGSLYEIYRKH